MLLGVFNNVNRCVSDSPKVVYIFGKSNMSAASKVKLGATKAENTEFIENKLNVKYSKDPIIEGGAAET